MHGTTVQEIRDSNICGVKYEEIFFTTNHELRRDV
jgi:hypothetical protein